MSAENTTSPTKLCPTCGTRLSQDATRCLVCGTNLTAPSVERASRPARGAVQGSRMPEITLSLPAALGLLALFLTIGAVLVYLALNQSPSQAAEALPTSTPTLTETPTLSPTPVTPTPTDTPQPTPTPLAYTVKLGDTCGLIAYSFGVSVQSIVLLNNLPADCSTLYENQQLLIPQPTPTATALPTSTLNPAEATEAACEKLPYTVQENDTLSSISLNYNVSADAIREYNGLVNDVVRFGQVLVIPLCRRNATPGPSPTPTLPPPYPAVNLLLPPDGAPFSTANDIITLQWASVGALRENEAYAVTVEDVTEGQGRKLLEYVSDTKYIVPVTFLPNDKVPHVFRWFVVPVRQMGTDDDGNPIWDTAGAVSASRVFTWFGTAPIVTPSP
jgi:LysM repeat protein/ribosomal protein L40E